MQGLFLINSMLLGVGLAMDAFSVSIANGINDTKMRRKMMISIAGTFAGFQFVMPMIGWICVHTITSVFTKFQLIVPWIALVLLLYIGGNMILGVIKDEEEEVGQALTVSLLMMQGLATSIDALSVGFAISEYGLYMAFICAGIIAVVTFAICIFGLFIGKCFGDVFGNKAEMVGGLILIGIGIEIFVKSVLL
ncbi:MAG: manganese efflux pump [Lachnospiraceae bacterium]|nr:manganese efflux pump [Lachnospiraceae bacterium]